MKKTSKKSVEKKCSCQGWYFGCTFCKEEFDNPCDLDQHIRKDHRNI